MTETDFLAWEDRQEICWEFDGFTPVAMTGGTFAHAAIQGNLIAALTNGLRGTGCRAVGSDLKVATSGSIRYPDAMVICRPVGPKVTVVDDPVVVFEILSPSTAATDRVTKNREYRDTPSIQRYVMLEQDRIAATVFARAGTDWIGHLLLADAVLDMPEIGVSIPLADFYEGIALDESQTAPPAATA